MSAPQNPRHVTPADEVLAQIRRLAGDAAEPSVGDFLDMFLSNTESNLTTLRLAATSDDLATLKKAAHKLRGSAGTFGARVLADLGFHLEILSDAALHEGAAELVARMEGEFARLKSELESRRSAPSGPGGKEPVTCGS